MTQKSRNRKVYRVLKHCVYSPPAFYIAQTSVSVDSKNCDAKFIKTEIVIKSPVQAAARTVFPQFYFLTVRKSLKHSRPLSKFELSQWSFSLLRMPFHCSRWIYPCQNARSEQWYSFLHCCKQVHCFYNTLRHSSTASIPALSTWCYTARLLYYKSGYTAKPTVFH